MLKLLGACLVIGACGLLGLELGKNFSRRTYELKQVQYALQALETEITYAATPLPQAMEAVAAQTKGNVSEIFFSAGREMTSGRGQTAAEVWVDVLKKKEPQLSLKISDIAIIKQFGQGLGISDREDQIKRLALARAQIAACEQQAETERLNMQKVWQSLGWAVGLAVTMLFI